MERTREAKLYAQKIDRLSLVLSTLIHNYTLNILILKFNLLPLIKC
jgi:hypothetical protein